ncbi:MULTISPECIES: glycosyl hydrolase family 18 protein [unclassified Enterococcus]|uniref:glycosyl hydrolase family 18 protein n=1 Tax=unclassified Enterococcus TaxID=2608891 RepID=UPI0013E99F20|nr:MULTISPECIES: glycosyl hydrolase family 18 protein [unclassified Enterococcus]
MKKTVKTKTFMKQLLTLSVIGASLFSPQLLNVYAKEQNTTASALTMDDSSNVINGLNETHMWSNNGGASWTRGREGQVFRGTQEVQVALYDQVIVDSEAWQSKSYTGGTYVLHNGNIWRNSYWAEPSDKPGEDAVWQLIKPLPAPLNTFRFNRFTGAQAEQLQKEEADRVQNQTKVIGYFANWHGYKTDYEPEKPDYNYSQGVLDGKGYDPVDVPFDKITHVNYAFMVIDDEGNLVSNDPWADFDEGHEGGGRNYINQIVQLAEENDVASMVSIGGWTNSVDDRGFDHATATPERMNRFTDQLVEFMLTYQFDGIDIDWEYPENEEEKEKFVALIKQLREKMTKAGKENDFYYQLSIAVTANHEKMAFIAPEITNDYVDNFNVMTYDFRGGFDTQTGHHSPLYPKASDTDEKFNVSAAMKEYHEVYGIPKQKLMVGMSYYSRGFANVEEAGIGVASNGPANGGTWDDPDELAGLKPWFQLKEFEAQAKDETVEHLSYHWDDEAQAPYIYDSKKKELYTYDNIETITKKVNYTIDNGYGGAIIWELAHDTPDTAEMTTIVAKVLEERKPIERIRIEKSSNANTIFLDLEEELRTANTNYRVEVNGAYRFSNERGINYYSYRTAKDGYTAIYRSDIPLKEGDKITLSARKQGERNHTLLQEIIVTKEMIPTIDERKEDITGFEVVGNRVLVNIKKEAQEANNHYVVTHNGNYMMSSRNRIVYYSWINRSSDIYTWTGNTTRPVKAGDVFEVYLAGDNHQNNLYDTITVK